MNNTAMINEVKKNLNEQGVAMSESIDFIQQAQTALTVIIDRYNWFNAPTVADFMGNAPGSGKFDSSEAAKHALDFLAGYREIMFLVRAARDYADQAFFALESAEL